MLDPACGSGAFLVGMMNVLLEIYKVIFRHLNREMSDFELKKRIIGRNLYGVDVMRWAVHSAELRLWLSLMIESDLTIFDLRRSPLLPNLNLKLRVGDSLVQEIGGLNLKIRDGEISFPIKRRLADLKNEKEKYCNNDPTGKYKTEKLILNEEVSIFNDIIEERIIKLQKEKQYLNLPKLKTGNMYSDMATYKVADDTDKDKANQIKEIDNEVNNLNLVRIKLKEHKPFVWDIDFAEIFGEKGGFDIVIGNPPYVRQEKISPPNVNKSELTLEERREYKEKLISSVKNQFDKVPTIDRRSDYYIYFYFHGLSLLNKRGTFCFITSNSWLDVGYGASLQEFLLRHVPIFAVYDNQSTRSFEHADVNTIIALFGAPIKGRGDFPALSNIARFVVFKKPFEEAINTKSLLEIEEAKEVLTSDSFRVFPKKQEDLLEEGWEYPEPDVIAGSGATKQSQTKSHSEPCPELDSGVVSAFRKSKSALFKDKFLTGKYTGNKWGGKYLRAPDIFFKILEKGKGKLVSLSSVAYIEGYIHGFNVGDEFPKDYFIESLEDAKLILLDKYSPGVKLFGIKKQGNSRVIADLLFPRMIGSRFLVLLNKENILGQKFYKIILKDEFKDLKITLSLFLNSTIQILQNEVIMLSPWGMGALSVNSNDVKQIKVTISLKFNRKLFEKLFTREIKSIFEELGFQKCSTRNCNHPVHPYEYIKPEEVSFEKIIPDRREFDKIVFEALGLTEEEQLEVYRAVVELVKNRLVKAKSV
ncbi:MAG: Modification methylase PaeR7I [candidate division WS2 bacterium]|uniref:site-specific DNA-methyltransferase (adenine-specific) n=1 Tax=Psychracetigena formicireducens TaxID=2986056 RepID=A0A9E2BIY3_PSYF1|nr:Modification methylase PaeR7I [Candidatus Psychracetigena formicireducens]